MDKRKFCVLDTLMKCCYVKVKHGLLIISVVSTIEKINKYSLELQRGGATVAWTFEIEPYVFCVFEMCAVLYRIQSPHHKRTNHSTVCLCRYVIIDKSQIKWLQIYDICIAGWVQNYSSTILRKMKQSILTMNIAWHHWLQKSRKTILHVKLKFLHYDRCHYIPCHKSMLSENFCIYYTLNFDHRY